MGVIEQAREGLRARLRAFVLGAGVVERSDMAWGHDVSDYAPPEYGDYIATSNGVYAAATLRAWMLTQLPLKLYRGQGDNRTEVTTGPAYDLLRNVNPHWTLNRLLYMTELSLCLWGSAYWFIERGAGGRGKPTEIWWGRPDRVKVIPHPTEYLQGFLYETGGEALPFTPGEVVWFRYPNPLDEYAGLSPLAAARLAADLASAGMQSNKALFSQGLQIGGVIYPKAPDVWSVEQADELSDWLHRRFRGVDKAHRWAVMRSEIGMEGAGVTPKDAEFLGAMRWSLNEIARAYGLPPELIGDHERATYSNMDQAYGGVWMTTMLPEARMVSEELTEQLLPMFGAGVDAAEFDTAQISALQEDENAAWQRADAQIARGVITINEWRGEQGLEAVAWGDVWWAPSGVQPVESGELPEGAGEQGSQGAEEQGSEGAEEQEDEGPEETERGLSLETFWRTRGLEYGGEEHVRMWRRYTARTDEWEGLVTAVIAPLFERQQDAVLQRLKQRRSGRTVEDAVADPFDMPRWIREFREKIRPVLRTIVEAAGLAAIEDLSEVAAGIAFDVSQYAVQQFIERRAQRFAQRVNETTWNALRESLSQGVANGESIKTLEGRVTAVMGDRIRSTPETIARTEVVGASNGGTLASWKQSGVVVGKVWLASLDGRERDTHGANGAHGQRVGINEMFIVGDGQGPAPGEIGLAEEDINCRCTMTAEVE